MRSSFSPVTVQIMELTKSLPQKWSVIQHTASKRGTGKYHTYSSVCVCTVVAEIHTISLDLLGRVTVGGLTILVTNYDFDSEPLRQYFKSLYWYIQIFSIEYYVNMLPTTIQLRSGTTIVLSRINKYESSLPPPYNVLTIFRCKYNCNCASWGIILQLRHNTIQVIVQCQALVARLFYNGPTFRLYSAFLRRSFFFLLMFH